MRMRAAYDGPGNVRELRNVSERATILHPEAEVSAEDIELLIGAAISVPHDMDDSVAVWEAASPDCIEDEPAEIADISAVATPLRPHGAGFHIDPRALVGAGSFAMLSLVAALEQSLIRPALHSSGAVIAAAAPP